MVLGRLSNGRLSVRLKLMLKVKMRTRQEEKNGASRLGVPDLRGENQVPP
jgi:hypothetical protein